MTVTRDERAKKAGGAWEIIKVVIQALLIAAVVRTFLYQPFSIPSGSMKSTLLIGDYLFVSKFSYGYSRYSFPFGFIPFNGRIFASEPARGDVAVFKLPQDNATDYIKRVIGLPGDRIRMIRGELHINGVKVQRTQVSDFLEPGFFGQPRRVRRFRETLPNGVSYETLEEGERGVDPATGIDPDNTPEYVVPPGHYFMMGDNRDNSQDSRFLGIVGYVPFENMIGRADVIFFSVDEQAAPWQVWLWPWTVRWSRLFTGI